MNYQAAFTRMESLRSARDEFFRREIEPLLGTQVGDVLCIPEELQAEMQRMHQEIQDFGAKLNAIPEFQDIMPHWKVLISGKQDIESEFIDAIAGEPDRKKAMDDAFQRLGGFPVGVSRCLDRAGYMQHGREVRRDGWTIWMRCTEGASRRVTAMLHRQFRSAIELGSIEVYRYFADHSLVAQTIAPSGGSGRQG